MFWLNESGAGFAPGQGRRPIPQIAGAQDVFVTRMHVRYDAERFPEDLVLQESADRNNFQARYVLRHPWKGERECPATEEYRREVIKRQEHEARQLAQLTGWNLAAIRKQMNLRTAANDGGKWWQNLWP